MLNLPSFTLAVIDPFAQATMTRLFASSKLMTKVCDASIVYRIIEGCTSSVCQSYNLTRTDGQICTSCRLEECSSGASFGKLSGAAAAIVFLLISSSAGASCHCG